MLCNERRLHTIAPKNARPHLAHFHLVRRQITIVLFQVFIHTAQTSNHFISHAAVAASAACTFVVVVVTEGFATLKYLRNIQFSQQYTKKYDKIRRKYIEYFIVRIPAYSEIYKIREMSHNHQLKYGFHLILASPSFVTVAIFRRFVVFCYFLPAAGINLKFFFFTYRWRATNAAHK